MIRQAISCDICASEKRQTNHWFVAYEQGGELRVSGWSSRHKLRPGSKHLCGQTCLHKLVDEFVAKTAAAPVQRTIDDVEEESSSMTDTSLTSSAAYAGPESSARLITSSAPIPPKPAVRPQLEVATMPLRPHSDAPAPLPANSARDARNWRAEAWERERKRELRAIENHPEIAARRRSTA